MYRKNYAIATNYLLRYTQIKQAVLQYWNSNVLRVDTLICNLIQKPNYSILRTGALWGVFGLWNEVIHHHLTL